MKCDGFEDWSQVAKFRLHDFAFNNKLNHNEKKIIHFKLIFRSLLPLGWRLHHRNGPKRRFHGTGLEPSEAKRWRPVCHPGARFQALRRRQYKSHQQWKQPEQHQHRTTADKWVIALFYFLIHSKKRVNKISCSRFKLNIFNNKKKHQIHLSHIFLQSIPKLLSLTLENETYLQQLKRNKKKNRKYHNARRVP